MHHHQSPVVGRHDRDAVESHRAWGSSFTGFHDAELERAFSRDVLWGSAKHPSALCIVTVLGTLLLMECVRLSIAAGSDSPLRVPFTVIMVTTFVVLLITLLVSRCALRMDTQREKQLLFNRSPSEKRDTKLAEVIIPIMVVLCMTFLGVASILSDATCPWLFDPSLDGVVSTTGTNDTAQAVSRVVMVEYKRAFCFERLGGDVAVLSAIIVPYSIFFAPLPAICASVVIQVAAFVAANVVSTSAMHDTSSAAFSSVSLADPAYNRTSMEVVILDSRTSLLVFRSLVLCLGGVAVVIVAWKRDGLLRADYVSITQLLHDSQHGSKLYEALAQQTTATLPSHVVKRLLRRRRVRDFVPQAGVLAFGISSFSLMCTHYSCCDVVESLNGLFSILDLELSHHPNVTKMQTLGDLFLAVSGIAWEVVADLDGSDENTTVPPLADRPTLAAIDLNQYAVAAHSACVASTIITRFETSFCIVLHSGPITATTFGKSATYVCVGAGVSECIHALRSNSSSSHRPQSATSEPPRSSSLGGVIITTPVFSELLANGSAALSSRRKKHPRRADNIPVVLRLDELRRLQQVLQEDCPEVDGADISDSLRHHRKRSPGISWSTSGNNNNNVPASVMSDDRLIDIEARNGSKKHGDSDSRSSQAQWMPRRSRMSGLAQMVNASYASEEAEKQFQSFCTDIGEDSVIARWGFAFDGCIYSVVCICLFVFHGSHLRATASIVAGTILCVAAAVIPFLRIAADVLSSTPAAALDTTDSYHIAQTSATSANTVNVQCMRGSMKFLWYVSLAAIIIALFTLPHEWVAGWCATFLATILLWRCALPLVASRPHTMILVDTAVLCVPLAAAKLTRLYWFVSSTPGRVFPSNDRLAALAELIYHNDESKGGPLVSMIVQTLWLLIILLPAMMWIVRVARQENHRQKFERRQRAAMDMELIREQREILQFHIRSVIPRHMQDRFEEFQKNGILADDGNDTIDPWRGTWFATNVQETPLLIMELSPSYGGGDNSTLAVDEMVNFHPVMELEEAHRKVESVLGMMSSVCKAKSAGDIIILIGSEKDEEAVRAMNLMECAAALLRTFGSNSNGPKIVLNSGLAVGAVIGSDRLTFELFGEVVSTSVELLNAMPIHGIVATQRFIMMYHQLRQASLLSCFPTKLQTTGGDGWNVLHQQQTPHQITTTEGLVSSTSSTHQQPIVHPCTTDSQTFPCLRGEGAPRLDASPLVSQYDGSVVDLGFRLYLSQTGGALGSEGSLFVEPAVASVGGSNSRGERSDGTSRHHQDHCTASHPHHVATAEHGYHHLSDHHQPVRNPIAAESVTVCSIPIPPTAANDIESIVGFTHHPPQTPSTPTFHELPAATKARSPRHGQGASSEGAIATTLNGGSGEAAHGSDDNSHLVPLRGAHDHFVGQRQQGIPSAPFVLHPTPMVVDSIGLALAIPPALANELPWEMEEGNSTLPPRPLIIAGHERGLCSDVQIGVLQLWRVRGCGTIALHTVQLSFS